MREIKRVGRYRQRAFFFGECENPRTSDFREMLFESLRKAKCALPNFVETNVRRGVEGSLYQHSCEADEFAHPLPDDKESRHPMERQSEKSL